jgi:phytoene synthase
MTGQWIDQYRLCRQIARGASSSFPRFFRMLPIEKRRSMYALYAFFRHTDDLGDDESRTTAERDASLNNWQTQWDAALAGDASHEWLPAVVDTVQRFEIPRQTLQDVIDGCCQDLTHATYGTYGELSEYCHLVASSVGLACMHVWGFEQSPEALSHAKSAGLAFQLTNILRDIQEDLQRDRVYLPQEELARFGWNPSVDCQPTEGFDDLLRFQVDRAKSLYTEAHDLLPLLSRDGRRVYLAMHGCYAAILQKIEKRGRAILQERVRLGLPGLLWVVFRGQIFSK